MMKSSTTFRKCIHCKRCALSFTLLLTVLTCITLKLYSDTTTSWQTTHHNKPRYIGNIENSRQSVFFGIFSSSKNAELRNAQRQTWVATAANTRLPFTFKYKFLVDSLNTDLINENRVFNDIVFMNMTKSSYDEKSGEMTYLWLRYVTTHYPDTRLTVRVTDDMFLCVPQVFFQLDAIQSERLYYSWFRHHDDGVTDTDIRTNETFVAIGDELRREIVEDQHFTHPVSCSNYQLISDRLSKYNDVDFYIDNSPIRHCETNMVGEFKDFDKYFCDKMLMCHQSDPQLMQKLHAFNYNTNAQLCNTDGIKAERRITGVTGSLFSGEVIRNLTASYKLSIEAPKVRHDGGYNCENWAVVTTIFRPSQAVIQMFLQPDWCLVIVADEKTPTKKDYMKEIKSKKVKFLPLDEQNHLYPLLSKVISVNHFGRKNIGYMYAIQHNVSMIWDFDDDNIGVVNLLDFSKDAKFVTLCPDFQEKVVNLYPYFNPKDPKVWPRGFPLQQIKNNATVARACDLPAAPRLGVVQSLANIQPDVDAVYRLTRDMPLDFRSNPPTHRSLVLPARVFAPFNAQATLWLAPAFRYLALPISVHGRVSDIWRGYFAQHFLHQTGYRLAFSAPYVDQVRNEHQDIRDFNAELDLYERSEQLVDFLAAMGESLMSNSQGDESQANDLQAPPGSLQGLYERLYQRGYIHEEDLQFINAWELTLKT